MHLGFGPLSFSLRLQPLVQRPLTPCRLRAFANLNLGIMNVRQ